MNLKLSTPNRSNTFRNWFNSPKLISGRSNSFPSQKLNLFSLNHSSVGIFFTLGTGQSGSSTNENKRSAPGNRPKYSNNISKSASVSHLTSRASLYASIIASVAWPVAPKIDIGCRQNLMLLKTLLSQTHQGVFRIQRYCLPHLDLPMVR